MFKVGDKVKVIYNSNGSGIVKAAMNKVGVVHKCSDYDDLLYIEFGEKVFSDLFIIGFFKNEIEKVSTKGEQLLFEFML